MRHTDKLIALCDNLEVAGILQVTVINIFNPVNIVIGNDDSTLFPGESDDWVLEARKTRFCLGKRR